jgi:Ni/Co efflux regulator RcnB
MSYTQRLKARYAAEARDGVVAVGAGDARLANLPPLERIPSFATSVEAAPAPTSSSAALQAIPVTTYLANQRRGGHADIGHMLATLAPQQRLMVEALMDDHQAAFDNVLLSNDSKGLSALLNTVKTTAVMLGDPEIAEARGLEEDRTSFDHFMLHSTELGASVQAGAPTLDKNLISKAIDGIKKRRAHAKMKKAEKKARAEAEDPEHTAKGRGHRHQGNKYRDPAAHWGEGAPDWADYRMDTEATAAVTTATAATDAPSYGRSLWDRIKSGARKAGTYMTGPRSTLIARPLAEAGRVQGAGARHVATAFLAAEQGSQVDVGAIQDARGIESEKGGKFTMELHGAKKRFTGTLFSGKARVPITRVNLGDGNVLDYYVVNKLGEKTQATKKNLLADDGQGGHVGVQLDMHLKGGTVSVRPDFGTLNGVKSDDARLAHRVWSPPPTSSPTSALLKTI